MSILRMRKKMASYFKYVMLAIAFAFAVGFVGMTLGGSGGRGGGAEELRDVFAKVNGEKLQGKAYWMLLDRELGSLARERAVGPMEESRIRGKVFDDLVDNMLRIRAADREGLRVSKRELRESIDRYVDEQIKQIKDQLLADRKNKTDKALEAQLARFEPGMTVKKKKNQIRKELWKHKDDIRNSVLIEKLAKKLSDSVKITDKSLLESYDEVKLGQITVGIQTRSSAQAKRRAQELAGKLRKGADFAELARMHSDDGFKASGGDRGSMRRAWIEKELRDVAFNLKTGEISDPIKTDRGFVILRSEGVTRKLPPDFNDPKKKKEYRQALETQEQSRAQYEYFDNLRKTAKIEVYDPELQAYLAIKGVFGWLGQGTPAERKRNIEKAIKAYRVALVQAGDDSGLMARCYVQIGSLYGMMLAGSGFDAAEAERNKYRSEARRALEKALDYTESNDIRMMLAGMYVDAREYDRAVEHLEMASENAFDDYPTHVQVKDLYTRMNRPELAAKEQEWMEEYAKQRQEEGPAGGVTGPEPEG